MERHSQDSHESFLKIWYIAYMTLTSASWNITKPQKNKGILFHTYFFLFDIFCFKMLKKNKDTFLQMEWKWRKIWILLLVLLLYAFWVYKNNHLRVAHHQLCASTILFPWKSSVKYVYYLFGFSSQSLLYLFFLFSLPTQTRNTGMGREKCYSLTTRRSRQIYMKKKQSSVQYSREKNLPLLLCKQMGNRKRDAVGILFLPGYSF